MSVMVAELPPLQLPAPPARSNRSASVESIGLPSALTDLVPPRALITTADSESLIRVGGGVEVQLKVDARPGCGGIAWPSGEVLSRYLAHRCKRDPSFLKGKRILELGSGTGLVGIAAGLLDSSARIWITDQKQLLDLMSTNTTLNGVNSHVIVEELNWGEPLPRTIPSNDLDLVLAADCVYFEPAFPLLVKTLCDLAPMSKELEILFCWKKRRKADKRFFAQLKKHFTMEVVEDDDPSEKERYTRQGVNLLRLTRYK